MTNDLIVAPTGTNWTTGAGFLSGGKVLVDDLNSASADGVDIAIDSVMETLDILGLVLDPLGGIFQAGVGWLINHIGFLKEPVDAMLGDPAEITAVASTWANIGKAMADSCSEFGQEVGSVNAWTGEAADHYRASGSVYADLLGGAAGAAFALSGLVTATGVLVAMTRDAVFKAIAAFVERVVIYVISALASSWITFGASLEVAVAVIEVDAEMQAVSIETTVVKVEAEVTVYTGKLGRIAQKLEPIIQALERWKIRMDGSKLRAAMDLLDTRPGQIARQGVRQGDAARKNTEKHDHENP